MTIRCLCSIVVIVLTPLRAAAPEKPFGHLFDIGGRKLHLACMGKGSPAVILISGAGEFSFDWTLVMPSIAKTTKVCAWDRAGYAWSDMSPDFEQLPAVAADMRTLLHKADIPAPWILVGHGMGAIYARDYQRRYPEEVSGLLLVDPMPEEDVQVNMFGRTVSLIDMADHDLVAWPVRPYGPSRTSPPPKPGAASSPLLPFDRLARRWQTTRVWASNRLFEELTALSADQAHAVMESERATFKDLYDARHGTRLSLPVIVLSRGNDVTPEIAGMQDEIGRISKRATHRNVESSGTQIQIERPDVVAAAVAELVRP